ncbi:MAG: Hsp70 family protein [Synergistaceae bacterium]|jgi:molecular chaperone DnaK (HSP70)|nr:Hsp70 family protein [Synergistaceae bacterium]
MGEYVVGIDLGTRYAEAAVDIPGRGVSIIPNRWGENRAPSMVAYTKDGLVAGEDAARVMLTEPESVWWDMKRRLGSDWTARVGGRSLGPEEMLPPLLSLLREDAEAFLDTFVSSCVLAAPAHFGFPERGALARAARNAGFERVRIVNEPTAAALSAGIDGRFLVMDFGAGTLDMSLVEGDGGVFQVLDSEGRRDIGGLDIDRLLAEWLCRNAGVPLSRPDDPRASLMTREAENVKIALSHAKRVTWRAPAGLAADGGRSVDIERAEFESLIYHLMEEILNMVVKMWRKYEPDRLLTVGGSSGIPLLRRMLAERVREPDRVGSSGSEYAVVAGSALYAHQGRERLLIDVLSESLGIMNADGEVVPLLRKGAPLPARARQAFTASGSGSIEVTVARGERRVRGADRAGRILQTLTIDKISDGETVEVDFKIDGGGLLHVEVKRGANTSRRTISLDFDDSDGTPCDLASEMRIREDRIAKLSGGYPGDYRARLLNIAKDARLLKNGDPSLRWQALAVLDNMIAELERAPAK